jgi:hypothetical protein
MPTERGTARQVKKPSVRTFREDFLAWQCRIRQIAMRAEGGRPSQGMRPRVLDEAGTEFSAALTVLLVPKKPEESTAFFRFQVMRSADPRDLYERGLAYLQADYFHRPHNFSDKVTAVLDAASPLAATLLAEKHCVLAFDQFSQRYLVPCAATLLATRDAAREASLWHNRIFNPSLPDEVSVIQFKPDWASARSA